mmetsp:Transcript_24339/g.62214  ORF Transcript_24339/g.62214 Transcript_24339/m.62214 type:complete len:218 (-) Transcript_24339:8-661(-)
MVDGRRHVAGDRNHGWPRLLHDHHYELEGGRDRGDFFGGLRRLLRDLLAAHRLRLLQGGRRPPRLAVRGAPRDDEAQQRLARQRSGPAAAAAAPAVAPRAGARGAAVDGHGHAELGRVGRWEWLVSRLLHPELLREARRGAHRRHGHLDRLLDGVAAGGAHAYGAGPRALPRAPLRRVLKESEAAPRRAQRWAPARLKQRAPQWLEPCRFRIASCGA